MSSSVRSGCSPMISSFVMPSATIVTTVATGMRRPLIPGKPPIVSGSVVTRPNSTLRMLASATLARSLAIRDSLHLTYDEQPASAQEVVTMTSAEALTPWPSDEHVPIEELARRQGVEPVGSLDDLACPELWDSDEEYERFLADLYASRRSGLA